MQLQSNKINTIKCSIINTNLFIINSKTYATQSIFAIILTRAYDSKQHRPNIGTFFKTVFCLATLAVNVYTGFKRSKYFQMLL